MTRQTEPRRRPGHARLAPPPAVVALPAPAASHAVQSLPPADVRRHAELAPPRPHAIPAISIHAFCEVAGTTAALEAASADRRLAKALLEVMGGGIDAAVADCAETRAPNLLVVETTLPRSEMLARIGALTERRGPTTKVILIGHVNDIALYRKLMRRGIDEYLVAPVSPELFIDAVAGLVGAACEAQAGRVIAFIGAKGGAGSSTVCHNAAWAMSELLKREVVVADLDLAFGTAGLDFNQEESLQGMADALHTRERLDVALLDRLITKCSQHLGILAAPVALDRDYDISAGACRNLLDALRHYAPFTALDLPHLWAPWVKQALLDADEIVVTAAPDLANLRNARNLVDLLESGRYGGKPPRLVINMAKRRRRPDLSVEQFVSLLDLEPAFVIEFDAETFGRAADKGQMIEELSRNARAAQQFRQLALALAQRTEPKEAAKASPLAPIFDRLKLRMHL